MKPSRLPMNMNMVMALLFLRVMVIQQGNFAERVQVGMVGINIPIPVPVAYHSFGGWKHSIFSDIGMYGPEGCSFLY